MAMRSNPMKSSGFRGETLLLSYYHWYLVQGFNMSKSGSRRRQQTPGENS